MIFVQFAPFLLTPSSFPRKEFHKAVELQTIINRLMHNVAHDEEFLTTTLAETVKVDDFTGNLFKIYKKVLANGFGQVGTFIILLYVPMLFIIIIIIILFIHNVFCF